MRQWGAEIGCEEPARIGAHRRAPHASPIDPMSHPLHPAPPDSAPPEPAPIEAALTDLAAPSSPRRYQGDSGLDRVIGEGAFGRVLLVFDAQLGREVALKELRAAAAATSDSSPSEDTVGWASAPAEPPPEVVARFIREARLTARLEHPGIVPVHEIGRRGDGAYYYTMKPVRGRTLAVALQEAGTLQGRLGLLEAFVDLCQAVAYAHSRGVIHRDLKPQNVMVGAFGETVLLDWGLALDRSAEHPEDTDAQAGVAVGTPSYMSPEQAWGQHDLIDERSDVWGLGAILYELLTGSAPYRGPTAEGVIAQVRRGPPPPARAAQSSVPAELSDVAAKAMQVDPAERYGDPSALAADIRAWRAGERVSAHHYGLAERVGRQVARHGGRLAALAAGLTLLLAVSAVLTARVAAQRDRAVRAEVTAAAKGEEARRRLADALMAKAEDAVVAGSSAEALVYASDALAIREDPRARGALIAADSGLLRQVVWSARTAGTPTGFTWSPTAGLSVLEEDRLERWSADGEPLPTLRGMPPVQTGGAVQWSPTGALLAVGGWGGVRVFDPDERVDGPIQTLPAPVTPLSLAWLDDVRLVAADDGGVVGVWSARTGARLGERRDQPGAIRALALAGGSVVSASNDHSIEVWDPLSGRQTVRLQDEGVGAIALAVTPDHRQLAAVGEVRGGDGRLRVWDLESGALTASVLGHRAEAADVQASPDGRWLASSSIDGTLHLWSLPGVTEAATLRLPAEGFQRCAFSPDGRRLATVGRAGVLRVWAIDPENGGTPPMHLPAAVNDVAWSPDDRALALAIETGELRLIDLVRRSSQTLTSGRGSLGVAAWLDARSILVHGGEQPPEIVRLDGERLPLSPEPWWAARSLSPSRRLLFTTRHREARASVIEVATGVGRPLDCPALAPEGAWLPGEAALLVTGKQGEGVYRAAAAGGACERVGPAELACDTVAVSPDGQTMACARTGEVSLYRLSPFTPAGALASPGRVTAELRWTPDGRRIIGVDWSGHASVWATDGQLLARWQAHSNRIWHLALSADGRRIATASADRSARVWVLDALDEARESASARALRMTGLEVVDGELVAKR